MPAIITEDAPPLITNHNTRVHDVFAQKIKNANIYIYDHLAKDLHEDRYIYGAYGAIDGLNLALTIPKLGFEIAYFNSDINYVTAFHNACSNPEYLPEIVCGGILFISASVLGGFFSDKDDDFFKRNLAIVWPYIRDMLKALKWAYKGVRNTFAAIEQFKTGVHHLLLPIGLALAAVSVLNRMWYRSMKNERKDMQDKNDALTRLVKQTEFKSRSEWQAFSLDINDELAKNAQTSSLKNRSFVSAAFAGATEGLYFYFASATLAAFSPQVFIAMLVFSTFLTLSYICSRLFEEYDYQRKLISTALNTKIALCKQEIYFALEEMTSAIEPAEYVRQYTAYKQLVLEYTNIQKEREDVVRFSYGMAVLYGVKNGLTTQGVISSMMMCMVTILLLMGIQCPPIFVVSCVVAGVGCVLYCIYSAIKNHNLHMQLHPLTHGINPELNRLSATISQENITEYKKLIYSELHRKIIKTSSPDTSYYGLCEIFRQAFSGGVKGPKGWDEIMHDNSLHYLGWIPCMSIFCTYLAASLSSAGRALAREFGAANSPKNKQATQGKLGFFADRPIDTSDDEFKPDASTALG